jgi:hypothetical protein
MLLELPNRAPIPALDVCACCMATGAAADLKKVRCGARDPDDGERAITVRIPLPMCAVCRRQNLRFKRTGEIAVALACGMALVGGVIGFILDDIITALIMAFVAFVSVLCVGMMFFRIQRRRLTGHAPQCQPLLSAQKCVDFSGVDSTHHAISTLFLVEFANDAFATRILSVATASIRLLGSWSSIGILFDIDVLNRAIDSQAGGGSAFREYGYQARTIFMKLLDPRAIGAAFVFHGDTSATLAGRSRQWCIAIAVKDLAAIERVVKTFASAEEEGLAAPSQRITHHPCDILWDRQSPKRMGAEPLSLWFTTDDEGTILLPDPVDQEDVDLCARYKRPCRLPKVRAERSATGAKDSSHFRTPDGTVTFRCPPAWKAIPAISKDACLAVTDPQGSVLIEILTADAPASSELQPNDLGSLEKIAAEAIDGLRRTHASLRVVQPPAQLPEWPEDKGVCVHFTVGYPEGIVKGRQLVSITDSFLIGKGSKFAHLNVKCEESAHDDVKIVTQSILRSLRIDSGALGQPQATQPGLSETSTPTMTGAGEPSSALEAIRRNAALAIEQLTPVSQMDFGYNPESVTWLEGYIESLRVSGGFGDKDETSTLQSVFGSFLGECIVRCYGGTWAFHDGTWRVAFDDGNAAYPFAKVAKQMQAGLEEGIAGFFRMIPVVFNARLEPPS